MPKAVVVVAVMAVEDVRAEAGEVTAATVVKTVVDAADVAADEGATKRGAHATGNQREGILGILQVLLGRSISKPAANRLPTRLGFNRDVRASKRGETRVGQPAPHILFAVL
jgi:hypothetical protein